MRLRLSDAIDFLEGRVIEDDRQIALADMRNRLVVATDDRSLNQVRNELAADFNGYAAGEMLFGPQIGATTAAAGTYRITLTANGRSYEGSITIRDDPMMTEHGGR